jgi:hypothetical protein
MDPVRELAQLRQPGFELVAESPEEIRELRIVIRRPTPDEPEQQRRRDEALLGAVVEVALDAPACLIGRFHDPDA